MGRQRIFIFEVHSIFSLWWEQSRFWWIRHNYWLRKQSNRCKSNLNPEKKNVGETIKQASVKPQQHERKNSLTSEEQDTPEDDISGENKTDKIDIVNSIQLIEHKVCELSNCLDKHLDFITKKIEQIERQDGLWDQKTLEIQSYIDKKLDIHKDLITKKIEKIQEHDIFTLMKKTKMDIQSYVDT